MLHIYREKNVPGEIVLILGFFIKKFIEKNTSSFF